MSLITLASFVKLNRQAAGLLHQLPCMRVGVHARSFALTSARPDSKDLTKQETTEQAKDEKEPTAHDTSQKMVRAHYLDKKTLVWDKRYKSVAEVPDMLPFQTIVQSRNRFRIRANLLMIGLTVLAALGMVYTGKERAKAGETVEKRTIERHRQLRAQRAEEERQGAAAAPAEPDK